MTKFNATAEARSIIDQIRGHRYKPRGLRSDFWYEPSELEHIRVKGWSGYLVICETPLGVRRIPLSQIIDMEQIK